MGYVYVIGPAEPCEPYRVKIGWAKNPAKRLGDLQCGSPVLLELLLSVESDNAQSLEAKMHIALAPFRVHGEWFDLGSDPLEVIGERLPDLPNSAWSNCFRPRDSRHPAQDRVLAVISDGRFWHYTKVAEALSLEPSAVRVILFRLKTRGLVQQQGRGHYRSLLYVNKSAA